MNRKSPVSGRHHALNPRSVRALIEAGQLFHARGWVPATAGNFSFRIDAATIAVTASGCHKGELGARDLLRVKTDGTVLGRGSTASAETPLHCMLYRRDPEIGAVLHTHSPAATVLSRQHDVIRLAGYELMKILDGIETHDTVVELPVFDNDQDLQRLGRVVGARMDDGGAAQAYLIRGHGLYAWGRNVNEACHRVEALEFLLECVWRERLGPHIVGEGERFQ